MKVFAVSKPNKPLSPEEQKAIMPKEVPATLKLYLEGVIDQFWFTLDKPGVVFLVNADSVEDAKAKIEALPLANAGYLSFDYIPVGPLAPLGLLLQSA